jgi:hypothetical protein
VGIFLFAYKATSMSDIVLKNDGTLKIKSSIIVKVADPNSSVPGVSGPELA